MSQKMLNFPVLNAFLRHSSNNSSSNQMDSCSQEPFAFILFFIQAAKKCASFQFWERDRTKMTENELVETCCRQWNCFFPKKLDGFFPSKSLSTIICIEVFSVTILHSATCIGNPIDVIGQKRQPKTIFFDA